jgi:hypothetical protein
MIFIIKRCSDSEYEEEKEIWDLDELIAYLQEWDITLSFDRNVNWPTWKIQLLIED